MLNYINRILINTIKFDCRFISIVKKHKNPVITPDERFVPDPNDNVPLTFKSPSGKTRTNFFELYSDKAIEKLTVTDERFGTVLINARSVSNDGNQSMVVEGINMIRDAIKLRGKMTHLFFTERKLLEELPVKATDELPQVYYVTYRSMKKFSNLKTPPGIMAVFKRPDPNDLLVDPHLNRKLPVTVIVDNLRDPGNLGTLIRTAAGFSVNKILLSVGCVNLYNDKVLRGSMSSVFHVPIFHDLSWDDIRAAISPRCVVHYADVKDSSISPPNTGESFLYFDDNLVDFRGENSYGLIVGGEIDSVSEEARSLCEETHGCRLSIPLNSAINSLNSSIAAAIILSEFQRKLFLTKFNK